VGNQVDARTEHAPSRMRARTRAALQHFAAQFEAVVAIDAAGDQARIACDTGCSASSSPSAKTGRRSGNGSGRRRPRSVRRSRRAVHLHAIAGRNAARSKGALPTRNAAACPQPVKTICTWRTGQAQHGAEAEFRFGAAEPALPWAEFEHVSARSATGHGGTAAHGDWPARAHSRRRSRRSTGGQSGRVAAGAFGEPG
jgi:hypothetical protein